MVRTPSPEKKANLMRAALTLFVAQGVTNTSTAEIARAAGTASGTLFLYFPTRQDLLDELVLTIGQEQSELVQALLQPSFSAQETFSTIWHASVRWFLEHLEAYLYLQQVRDSGLISPEAVQESAKFFGYYYIAIQKGLAEGSIKPYPLELVGDFLYHDLVAITNHARRQPDAGQVTQSIQQGFEIFWDGIKSAGPKSEAL